MTSLTKPSARYPDTTFGPAPGAAHRLARRTGALRMVDAPKKRNLTAARIFVIEAPNRPRSAARLTVKPIKRVSRSSGCNTTATLPGKLSDGPAAAPGASGGL